MILNKKKKKKKMHNKSLGDLPCAYIRQFSSPITHHQWYKGSPSGHAILPSKEYQRYLILTKDGRFVGNFIGFIDMYEYLCELYRL